KEPLDLSRQRVRLAGVGAAGMARRAHRAPAEGLLQLVAAGLGPGALEEPGGVEALDHQPGLLGARCLPMPLAEDRAHLLNGVVPVEELDEVQERAWEHGDLIGEAGGIAKGDAALPLVLDREGLERAEAWVVDHSASR